MFGWLGRTVVRHPWWTIVAWLVAAAVAVVLAPKLDTHSDQQDFLPTKYESVQAGKLADRAFPSGSQKVSNELMVVKRSDGQALSSTDQKKVGQIAQALQAKHIPGITAVATSAQTLSQNHRIQIVMVPLPANFSDQKLEKKNEDAIKKLRVAATQEFQGTGLHYGISGNVSSQIDNAESGNKTFALIGIATVVLIIALILIIFRAPIAALLPIFVVGLVLEASNAVSAIIGNAFDLKFDSSMEPLILIVLYGIGTDYILFLLFRYRERLRLGEDKKTAMIVTVERVGEAIASAAGAVIIAFLVLLLAKFKSFGALGPQLAIAVGVMLITALTLVPAVVSLLGRAVFWPSKSWKKEPKASVFTRLGNAVGRRPLVTAVASGVVLLALASVALGFKADYDFSAGQPQNTESAMALKDLRSSLPPGLTDPTQVYVQGNGQLDKQALEQFRQKINASGYGQAGQAELNPDKTVAKIPVILKLNPNSNEAIDLVKGPLRDTVHRNAPPGTKVLVGGTTAVFADINAVSSRDLSVILPVAIVLIAIILALLLRALVAPVYLVVAVLLGFTATLGASVALFQGAEGKEGLMFQMPIILYLFVLAIGTDYNILMIARLREEAREGHDPRRAAAVGIQHAGPTVAAAGVILAGSFAVLVLSPMSFLAQIGFGVAIGILLSAFVVSTFFVPAVTALIGHAAWWPGHADRAKKPGPPAAEPYELAGRPH
ncbi:MMPL family transporter [Actinoallomurus iriomotensis]|uniref:Membrane protein n=1 Tax=Actinoallomurus iriomotensis TaxID=478107 RepID=A0A9W6RG13_9ACTN|nr:MMPL family transporter [Actinoallomurus iriomotensis]GLY73377.1 putative membrane protein [Actinoallomurus iriomotensis]